ncbi:MAG: fimbrillin family protein [Rikenellaceae bacterium]
MKKLFIFLAASTFAVACQESQLSEGSVASGEISFKSSIDTKATDTNFETGDQIAVTAYNSDGSIFEKSVEYTYSNSLFTSTTPIDGGIAEKALSYRALYPYTDIPESDLFYFTTKTDQSSGDNYTQSDLMHSYVESTTSTTPELVFDHLLSQVVINVSSDEVSVSGAKVLLYAKNSIEYYFSTDKCSSLGNVTEITMADNGTDSYKAIIAPQWFVCSSSVFVTVEIDGVTYEAYFDEDKSFKSGMKYSYDFVISNGEVIFDGSVSTNPGEKQIAIESITITENIHGSLLVDLTMSPNYTGTYSIFPALKSDIDAYDGGIQAYVEDYVYSDVFVYGYDHTTVDFQYVFNYSLTDYDLLYWWLLQEYRDYMVIAVGVNNDGTLNTAITYSDTFRLASQFSPETVEMPDVDFGSITEVSSTYTSVTYDITPADKDMTYVVLATPMDIFEGYDTDVDQYILAMEYLESALLKLNYSLETGLVTVALTGDQTNVELTGLDAGTQYAIYAFGVDVANILPLTTVEVLEVETVAYEDQTGSLKGMTISDVSSTSALVSVDAGDYTGNYFVMPVSDATLSYYNGDMAACLQGAIDYNVLGSTKDFGVVDGYFIFNGDAEFYIGKSWTLDSGTHYTVGAAGVSPDGDIITDAVTADFTTTSTYGAPAFTSQGTAPIFNIEMVNPLKTQLYTFDNAKLSRK